MLTLVKALVLPPGSLLLLGIAGLALRRRFPRLGYGLATAALGLSYALCTPLVGDVSLSLLEPPYANPLDRPEGGAIVVLGGGTFGWAPEYSADVASPLTLVRLRYAAKLQRASGKPLLLSGGSVRGDTPPEALQMRAVLNEMQVPVHWTEERSVDTFTNALESYRMLAPAGITTVYLVTHAWHMPRARLAFEHAGFTVIPAPTGFRGGELSGIGVHDLLPRASALLNSYYFCHEVLGYLVYRIRMRA